MRYILSIGLFVAAALGFSESHAATSGALYDMSRFLQEPHPFARPYIQPAPQPYTQSAPVQAQRPPRQAYQTAAAPAVSRPLSPPNTGAENPLWGLISEIRLGALQHDEGPFSRNKEGGADINLEVLFASPGLLDILWSPRPHLGLSGHTEGDTNQLYLGLTWEWKFLTNAFFDFSLGGAVHNGETTNAPLGRKELGCSVLFRESLDLGYRFAGRHGVMIHLGHISNASLCDENEGLENFGIRYGYLF